MSLYRLPIIRYYIAPIQTGCPKAQRLRLNDQLISVATFNTEVAQPCFTPYILSVLTFSDSLHEAHWFDGVWYDLEAEREQSIQTYM